jgi:hypothetical protein
MRTILAILALANLLSTGCGFAARHPVQTKVYIIGAGVLVGGAIALSQRRGTCTQTYPSGYIYVGTNPCPGYK